MAGSGGFSPGLKTVDLGVNEDWAYLASEENLVSKRGGATFDATEVAADGNGDKIVAGGTAIAIVTAASKYAPYDDGNVDGTEVGTGILVHDINLRDGDIVAAVWLAGSFIEVRTTGVDAAFKVDVGDGFIWQ